MRRRKQRFLDEEVGSFEVFSKVDFDGIQVGNIDGFDEQVVLLDGQLKPAEAVVALMGRGAKGEAA